MLEQKKFGTSGPTYYTDHYYQKTGWPGRQSGLEDTQKYDDRQEKMTLSNTSYIQRTNLGKGSKYKKKSMNFFIPRLGGGGGSEVIFHTFQPFF